ncbi:MAG: hypothetical protein INQ03_11750 [Candidatus Heimdallarchaeota archaeon]|nr:hypothetical protein [Candidatus Heimdallarchaeota archaeon]
MPVKLPNHVPVYISQKDIERFSEHLTNEGYEWIFLQIIKPRQLVGRVKTITRKSKVIEHHVRVFTNGKITTEFELPRVEEMWEHITTVSYSAHERLISMLEEAGIAYTVDESLRTRYNNEAIDDYPKDHMEFVYWFFAGVLFWTPLGYIWRFFYNINLKRKKTSKKERSSDTKQQVGAEVPSN